MNDADLELAAYRYILNMAIPPLRAKKVPGFKISWPCNDGDWTLALLEYKNRKIMGIIGKDQHIIKCSIVPFALNPRKKILKEEDKVPIADPKCHIRVIEWFVDTMLKYFNPLPEGNNA